MTRTWRSAFFAAAATLVCLQLFVPPVLGIADNCDFEKLRTRACIGPEVPEKYPYFEYFVPGYAIRAQYCRAGTPTSAAIPLAISLWAARLVLPAGHYDLRLLAALYAILFLAAYWYFNRSAGPAAGVVVLAVFCSAVYVPLFSTFYMDAAAFIWLAWAVVLSIRILTADEVRWYTYLALAGFLVLLATSKTQYVLLPLCFLPVFWLRFGRKRFPAVLVRAAVSCAVLLAAGLYMSASSPWYRAVALFDGLFFKFLPACQNPAAEVRKLGLGPQFDNDVGKHAYYPETHMQESDFALAFGRVVGVPQMARFVLTHPSADVKALRHDLDEASLERVRMKIGQREYRLGNYEMDTGRAPESQSNFFTVWSAFKFTILARRPWIYLGYIVALFAALWTAAARQRTLRGPAIAGAAILTALLPASFLPAFLDAVDTGRHLAFFNCFLDMAACALFVLIVRLLFSPWGGQSWRQPPLRRPEPAESRLRAELPAPRCKK